MAKPDYVKPCLANKLATYKMVEDCYQGSEAVKGRSSISKGGHNNGGGSSQTIAISPYLPDPSPSSEDYDVRMSRYNDYVERAVFYNVTKRTVNAMSGAVFSKYPTMTLGDLEILETDADGAGKSLTQLAREALTNCLKQGRGLLLADMPVSEGVSKAAMAASGIRPIIAHYHSDSIINWRYRKVGGVLKPSLIVLSESYVAEDDGFEQKTAQQLLVLRLNDADQAESEIYRKDKTGEWISQGVNVMTDHKGKPLTDIPAYIYGAVNNDLEPDDVPMADLSHINISHFRNSADYEEMCFISSQPTLVVSGLDEYWANEILKGGLALGSRSGVLLPVGGSAAIIQAQANSVLFESMQHKESQMVSIGAKLIEQNKGQTKTATEASSDNADATSVLSSIANNVSDAFSKTIKACARYIGAEEKDLVFTLNTQFDFAKMTPQQRQQLIAEWQSGAISFAEMRGSLVESEIAQEEDSQKAKAIIEQEQANLMMTNEVG